MLEEDGFYDRLGDIFNDLLLTDRYLVYTGFAVNILNSEDFPNAGAWWEGLEESETSCASRSTAPPRASRSTSSTTSSATTGPSPRSSPPTTRCLNPFSAQLYNQELGFADPTDPREFKEAKLFSVRGGKKTLPHAGVLSSPMFLNRFPTTPTNRNRHRARMTYKLFLATDVLRIGERPIDPSLSEAYSEPDARRQASCNFCHQLIDPVAGAFQNFDDYDKEVLTTREVVPARCSRPAIGGEHIPKSDFPQVGSSGWRAARQGPAVRHRHRPHRLPRADRHRAAAVPDRRARTRCTAAKLNAWEAQDALFRQIARRLRGRQLQPQDGDRRRDR